MERERRGATRYNFGAVAEVIDIGQSHELVSLTRDVSLCGVFVKTISPFATGTRVQVRVTHSGAEFRAMGVVTNNVTATGMGIYLPRLGRMTEQYLKNGWRIPHEKIFQR